MRSIKELLEILLKLTSELDSFNGLCYLIIHAEGTKLITLDELVMLDSYIFSHKPKPYSSFGAMYSYCKQDNYYWPKGHKKPRIKWLQKHIKLNS